MIVSILRTVGSPFHDILVVSQGTETRYHCSVPLQEFISLLVSNLVGYSKKSFTTPVEYSQFLYELPDDFELPAYLTAID